MSYTHAFNHPARGRRKAHGSPPQSKPTVNTRSVQVPRLPATVLDRITDQEANDLNADCENASIMAIAASRCIGRIDEAELSQILFIRFSRLPEDRRQYWAMKTAAYRLIIDQLRRDAKRRTFDEMSSDVVTADPAESFDRREAAGILLTKIRSTLSATDNALIAFFLECEVAFGEHGAYIVIGEALGKKAKTIAVAVHRIRRRAARFLDDYEENFID